MIVNPTYRGGGGAQGRMEVRQVWHDPSYPIKWRFDIACDAEVLPHWRNGDWPAPERVGLLEISPLWEIRYWGQLLVPERRPLWPHGWPITP